MIGLLFGLWVFAAPTPPPAEVGALLSALEKPLADGDAAAVLAAVQAYDGPDHPLVSLSRGHALTLAGRHGEAIEAYRAALKADPKLKEAGMGLVGALARAERWGELCEELPRWMRPDDAEPRMLRLWTAAALATGDLLLAEEVARRGLVRFPRDAALRKALAHALAASGRPEAAAAIVRRLLADTPDDGELWQQLAATDTAHTRPALEAAVLSRPDDRDARRRLVSALLAAGQNPAALTYATPLADGSADDRLLLVQAAVAAEAFDRAQGWLAGLPADNERVQRLTARVALARGDRATARAALSALLAAGETDVLVPLATLERADGRWDRAEALLRQAASDDRPGAAPLHLAHLLLGRGRRGEAQAVLRDHLSRAPADGAARALLNAAER